jgi:hypothetical protein
MVSRTSAKLLATATRNSSAFREPGNSAPAQKAARNKPERIGNRIGRRAEAVLGPSDPGREPDGIPKGLPASMALPEFAAHVAKNNLITTGILPIFLGR